ncbi:MAG: hypothetical protein WCY28_03345 [Candidatus Shapirobacteria bacterium]|jgi:hypothetical protein
MDKTNIIILVLIGAVLFSVGGGLGIIYQSQKNYSEENIFKALSSKAVSSIAISGELKKVNNEKIILSYEEENFEIKVSENTRVYYFRESSPGETKDISIKDLKAGDRLNIEAVIINKDLQASIIGVGIKD